MEGLGQRDVAPGEGERGERRRRVEGNTVIGSLNGNTPVSEGCYHETSCVA